MRAMGPKAAYLTLGILLILAILAVLALTVGPPVTRIYFDNSPRQALHQP
jgi:hypothetical protein